jgi:hypothetical protein
VFAGGGIGGGRVLGDTGKIGEDCNNPVTVPDLFATICAAHGLDPAKKFFSHTTGVVKITENGNPLKTLF